MERGSGYAPFKYATSPVVTMVSEVTGRQPEAHAEEPYRTSSMQPSTHRSQQPLQGWSWMGLRQTEEGGGGGVGRTQLKNPATTAVRNHAD